jgi:uncharacterized membrane protein YagU involved in acid resistance
MNLSLGVLDGKKFKVVVIAGVIASYVMTVTATWQAGLGLKAMDPSALMIASLNRAHSEALYGIAFGHLYHYLNGIALALLYFVVFRSRLPGNWLVRGGLYGVIAFLVADIVVSPLATGSGIFFSNMPEPLLMTVSSLVPHLAYGVALTFCLAASSLQDTPCPGSE